MNEKLLITLGDLVARGNFEAALQEVRAAFPERVKELSLLELRLLQGVQGLVPLEQAQRDVADGLFGIVTSTIPPAPRNYNHRTDFAAEAAKHVLSQLLHLEHRWIARQKTYELADALFTAAVMATRLQQMDFLPFKEALARWTEHYWATLKKADDFVGMRALMYKLLSKGQYINLASAAKTAAETLPVREDLEVEYKCLIELLLSNEKRARHERAAHRLCAIAEYSCRRH